MLNDRDPDPYICIVQTDRLIFKYIIGAWLQFVYVSKRTFSSNILLRERFFFVVFVFVFVFPLISSFSILPTGKHTMCRWSGKEVE